MIPPVVLWRRRVLVALLGVVMAGWLGLVSVVAGVLALVAGLPARRLPQVGAGLLVVTALAWLIGNAGDTDTISFELVVANPWPQRFAVPALLLTVLGVAEDLAGSDPTGPDPTDPAGTRDTSRPEPAEEDPR